MKRRTASRPLAFTLIEVLVSLAIFSMIVTGIYSAFTIGFGFRETSRVHLNRLKEIRSLVLTIEDDLLNLAPLRPNLAVAEDRLALLRAPRSGARGGGTDASPTWVLYRHENAGPRSVLTREEYSLPEDLLLPGTAETALAAAVSEASYVPPNWGRGASHAWYGISEFASHRETERMEFGRVGSCRFVPLASTGHGTARAEYGVQDSLLALSLDLLMVPETEDDRTYESGARLGQLSLTLRVPAGRGTGAPQ